MAYAAVSGSTVLSGSLTLPRLGVWSALLCLDTVESLPREVEIQWGELNLRGAVVRAGIEAGALWCRIVGGKGCLGTSIRSAGFKRPKISAVLDALMDASGEQLSSDISDGFLSRQLDWFALMQGQTVGDALFKLAEATSSVWRVLPDGSVWMGEETWPVSKADSEEVEVLGVDMAALRLRARILNASNIFPGQIWEGSRIDRIEHTICGNSLSSEIWIEGEEGNPAILAPAAELE